MQQAGGVCWSPQPGCVAPARDGAANLCASRIERLDRGDVEQRADLEFCRHAVIGYVGADQDARAREHGHFRMSHVIGMTVRHNEAEWLKWVPRQKLAKCLGSHTPAIVAQPTVCRDSRAARGCGRQLMHFLVRDVGCRSTALRQATALLIIEVDGKQ